MGTRFPVRVECSWRLLRDLMRGFHSVKEERGKGLKGLACLGIDFFSISLGIWTVSLPAWRSGGPLGRELDGVRYAGRLIRCGAWYHSLSRGLR